MKSSALLHTLVILLACPVFFACSKKQPQPNQHTDGSSTMESISSAKRAFGPTVAGRFYPDEPKQLRSSIESYLDEGTKSLKLPSEKKVVALIAPHAGYVYSGRVAGAAYAAAKSSPPNTIVVLSPSHHARRPHACTLDADVYQTPLGKMPIAKESVQTLVARNPHLIQVDEAIFLPEHALDVHIPFLQVAFPQAQLVPIIVPMLPRKKLEDLGRLLHTVLEKDSSTLVVASSDLSHFFNDKQARLIDDTILKELERKELTTVLDKHDERRGPCGIAPILTAYAYLESFGAEGSVHRLMESNSGDTQPASRDRVVGYGALALMVDKPNG